MTEHLVRRFFDLMVLAALVVALVFMSWRYQENQARTDALAPGIDPGSVETTSSAGG